MLLKIIPLFLVGYCSGMQNFSCSLSGNSTEVCHNEFEVCCDHECLSLNQTCPGFDDDKIWVWSVFVIASLTDFAQIVIAVWYRDVYFYRLTWTGENEGFSYNHGMKYVEELIHQLSGGLIGRAKLRGKELKDLIDTEKLSLWISMIFSLALGFSQRLLDLPYLTYVYQVYTIHCTYTFVLVCTFVHEKLDMYKSCTKMLKNINFLEKRTKFLNVFLILTKNLN